GGAWMGAWPRRGPRRCCSPRWRRRTWRSRSALLSRRRSWVRCGRTGWRDGWSRWRPCGMWLDGEGAGFVKPILRAVGLAKVYENGDVKTPALQGVDLEVAPGEFTAVAGPSGSGKSTLLHLLGCLDRPTSGETWLGQQRTDQLDDFARARLRLHEIGFVFQAYNLIPVLTALENAAFVLELRGVPKKVRHEKAMAALEALGIADLAHRRPNQLSGGQQQRVAVARA